MPQINFSVIISTYNRATFLPKLIKSLRDQKFPKKRYEVIIVNNNSSDDTEKVINIAIAKYLDLKIRYLFEKKQGKSYALNKAVWIGKYQHYIFIDDDEIIDSEFLQKYYKAWLKHSSSDLGMIGGPILPAFENRETKSLYDLYKAKIDPWVFGLHYLGNKEKEIEDGALLGGNFSIRKKVLHRIGGFDTHFGVKRKFFYLIAEDFEICLRLKKNNYRIIYSPNIFLKNYIDHRRFSTSYLYRRYLVGGVENYLVHMKHSGTYFVFNEVKQFIKSCMKFKPVRFPFSFSSLFINFQSELCKLIFKVSYIVCFCIKFK